jgi:hypothetical protein
MTTKITTLTSKATGFTVKVEHFRKNHYLVWIDGRIAAEFDQFGLAHAWAQRTLIAGREAYIERLAFAA